MQTRQPNKTTTVYGTRIVPGLDWLVRFVGALDAGRTVPEMSNVALDASAIACMGIET